MVSYRWLARPHRALEIVFFECYNPTSFIFGDKDNDNNQYSQICQRFFLNIMTFLIFFM